MLTRFSTCAAAALALSTVAACGSSDQAFCDRWDVFQAAVQNTQTFSFEEGSVDLDELEAFGDDAPDELQDDADLAVGYLVDLHELYWDDDLTDTEREDALDELIDDVDLDEFGQAVAAIDYRNLEACV